MAPVHKILMPVQGRSILILGEQDDCLIVAAQVLEADLCAGLLRWLQVQKLLDQRVVTVIWYYVVGTPLHIGEEAFGRASRLYELDISLRQDTPWCGGMHVVQKLVAPVTEPLEQIARTDRGHNAVAVLN